MSVKGLERRLVSLERRALLLPIPPQISKPVVHLVQKWVRCSGEEWTVGRMKQIKAAFVRLANSQDPEVSWVKQSKRANRFFAGPIGTLEEWALNSEKSFAVAIQLLNIYTAFVSPELTQKQFAGAVASITQSSQQLHPRVGEFMTRLRDAVRVNSGVHCVNLDRLPRPLLHMVPSPVKSSPKLGLTSRGRMGLVSSPEGESIIDSISLLLESRKGVELVDSLPQVFTPLFQGIEHLVQGERKMHDLEFPPGYYIHSDLLMGRVSYLQEPGYKLRYVANPGRVYQRLLEPLGDALFEFSKTLPWDCTHDQARAIEPIQAHIKNGGTVHSIDLKAATDRFPLSFQMELLETLCHDPHHYLDIFWECSRGDWIMKDPSGSELTIKWAVGQPLGLYPSFAAFAISHGFLLQTLLNRPWNGEFYVLGDDVVILQDSLKEGYLAALKAFDIPVSSYKTTSGPLGEFAGKLITAHLTIPQLKWREPSDDNFVDLARLLGPDALPLFKARQRRVLSAIAEVPEMLGGLGWNPDGKPMLDRVPQWYFDLEETVNAMRTGDFRRWVNLYYRSDLGQMALMYPNAFPEGTGEPGPDTLAQRVVDLVQEWLGPTLVPISPLLGRNLAEAFAAGRVPGRITPPPVDITGGSRRSQLRRWEEILSLARD